MDDAELGRGQEKQRRAELLRQLPRQVQRDTAEVRVAQEVVQVVGKQLEHQAQVVPEHEVPLQVHCGKGTEMGQQRRNKLREAQWWLGVQVIRTAAGSRSGLLLEYWPNSGVPTGTSF